MRFKGSDYIVKTNETIDVEASTMAFKEALEKYVASTQSSQEEVLTMVLDFLGDKRLPMQLVVSHVANQLGTQEDFNSNYKVVKSCISKHTSTDKEGSSAILLTRGVGGGISARK